MSGFNGSGTYVRGYSWVTDAANSIPITASRVDADMADVVNGFNLCVTRDGQGYFNADINANGYHLKNLVSGSASAPAIYPQGGINTGFYFTATSVGISAAGTAAATFSSIGTSIAAPTSGTGASLTVTALAAGGQSNGPLQVSGNHATSGGNPFIGFIDTNASPVSWFLGAGVGTGTSSFGLYSGTTGANVLTVSATGNFIIPAPTSASAALYATANASGSAFQAGANGASSYAFYAACGAASQLNALFVTQSGQATWSLYQPASSNELRWFSVTDRVVFTPSGYGTAALRVLGGGYTPTVALTYGATTTMDCSTSNAFRVTLTGNITTFSVTNPSDGQSIVVRFIQDATGSRTIAWPASFRWAGGIAPALSTLANYHDLLTAQYDATDATWVCSLLKGIQ